MRVAVSVGNAGCVVSAPDVETAVRDFARAHKFDPAAVFAEAVGADQDIEQETAIRTPGNCPIIRFGSASTSECRDCECETCSNSPRYSGRPS